jgi:hypothetical protein
MSRAPRRLSALVQALCACSAAAAGCNEILGITPGLPGADGGSAGTAGAAGATSTGGTGGASGTCPPIIAVSCDPALLTDKDNCCIQGRSCLGGACEGGLCVPVVLDPDASTDTRGIGVSGDRVYWSTGTNQLIKSRKKDGTEYVEVVGDPSWMPSLAVDDTHVYWLEWNGGDVRRAPLTGAATGDVVASISATPDFGRIALSEGHVFWATRNPEIGVWAAPITTLTQQVTPIAVDAASGQAVQKVTYPTGVVADATHLYFSDTGDGSSPGRVLRRSLASIAAGEDIAAEIIATDEPGPGDLAVDAAHVYWVTNDGQIRRRAKDGTGAVETIAMDQYGSIAIAVDDVFVYWTVYGNGGDHDGAIRRSPKAGGGIATLADNQANPWEIALDCEAVYWTNHNDFGVGEVMKVAK